MPPGDPIDPTPRAGASDNTSAPLASGQIFLSYASSDTAIAEQVCEHLERSGIPCWIAPRDVPAGALYADAIVRAISSAKALVLILSAHSVGSTHVSKEVERASSKRRPIVALRIDDAALTPAFEYFLSESQWVDARTGLQSALAKLGDGIRRLASSTPRFANDPVTPTTTATAPGVNDPKKSRSALYVGAAVAAIAVVGLAALKFSPSKSPDAPIAATPSAPAPTATPATPSAVVQKSIAVLPFEDLSEKKDQGYFSDGLSAELIELLGRIPGLRVPARTSSFYFKGKQATLADIGKALNVTHVLEGTVQKSGNVVRITTELVGVADDSRVWSQTYDRKLQDIFKLQDDIANSVVSALKVSMLAPLAQRGAPTTNSEAYLLFLRSREAVQSGDFSGLNAAIINLKKAVALDPHFAEAWAFLGSAVMSDFAGSGHGNYADVRREALADVNRALAIDPNLARAHTVRARLYSTLDWDLKLAEPDLKAALTLDPNDELAQWLSGYIANLQGRFDDAARFHQRGRELDPLLPDNTRQLGNVYYRAGRLVEAAAALRSGIQRFPEATTFQYRLGLVLLAQGKAAEALSEFQREQDHSFSILGIPLALDALGQHAEADKYIARAIDDEQVANAAAYQIALVYAARGDKDRAFTWFERAYRQRDAGMLWIKYDPLLKGLRSDPRFAALVAKVGVFD